MAIARLYQYAPTGSSLVLVHENGTVVGVLAFSSGRWSETFAGNFAEAKEVSAILAAREQQIGRHNTSRLCSRHKIGGRLGAGTRLPAKICGVIKQDWYKYPFHGSWLKREFPKNLPPGVEVAGPFPLNRMIRARLHFASFLGAPVEVARAALRWDGRGL